MSAAPPPVLAAEDEETDAFIMRLAFEKVALPHPLIVVSNGQELVNYLSGTGAYADRATHPLPVLITLDLKMPRMNGFNVLAWLAERPVFSHIPVVVISSSSDEADIQDARALGAREYFVKPHRLDDYVEIVRLLSSHWLGAAGS